MAKYFIGMLAVLAAIAGVTAVGYQQWDRAIDISSGDSGADRNAIDLSVDQVLARGTVGALEISGGVPANLPMPLNAATAEVGVGGAMLTGATIDGQPATIEWTAGRPLLIEGDGELEMGPASVSIALDGGAILLGEEAHRLTPGTYTIKTSVAVGQGGTARPEDEVTFEIGEESSLVFKGDARVRLAEGPYVVAGTGDLTMQGRLLVTAADGSSSSFANLAAQAATFNVTLTRNPQTGFDVQATIQGEVTTS